MPGPDTPEPPGTSGLGLHSAVLISWLEVWSKMALCRLGHVGGMFLHMCGRPLVVQIKAGAEGMACVHEVILRVPVVQLHLSLPLDLSISAIQSVRSRALPFTV